MIAEKHKLFFSFFLKHADVNAILSTGTMSSRFASVMLGAQLPHEEMQGHTDVMRTDGLL